MLTQERISNIFMSRFMAKTPLTKDRLTRQRCINTSNKILYDTRVFINEEKKQQGSLCTFMLNGMKWLVMQKYDWRARQPLPKDNTLGGGELSNLF